MLEAHSTSQAGMPELRRDLRAILFVIPSKSCAKITSK